MKRLLAGKKQFHKRRTAAYLGGAVLLAVCALSGCAAGGEEEQPIVLTQQETQESAFKLVVASVADVTKTERVKCTYMQTREEELGFSVSGRQVSRVYVTEGESVRAGQLLAQLQDNGVEEQLRTLQYRIDRNRVYLDNAQLNRDYEISQEWLNFQYHSGQTAEDEKRVKEAVERIMQNYRYLTEDWQDAVELDTIELEKRKADTAYSYLRAGMDGTVSFVKEALEGSTCARGETVVKIIDSTDCVFAVEDASCADYFRDDREIRMDINYGTGVGSYQLVPYHREEWGDTLLFTMADGMTPSIEVGTVGYMSVVTGERTQVLSVPLQAVHRADGRPYVYVEGEDHFREMKWIETGLEGDTLAEVTAGLTEGERVIVQ